MPDLDSRPHSRSCGSQRHTHGLLCHANCPSCGGKDVCVTTPLGVIKEVQTRDENGQVKTFSDLGDALKYADKHQLVWKIFWYSSTGETLWLIRIKGAWEFFVHVPESLKTD